MPRGANGCPLNCPNASRAFSTIPTADKGLIKPLRPPGHLWLYFAAQNRMLQGRQRMQIFYSGRVQGVGFRYTAKMLARGFEVTGTVRNLLDGRVELVAEGAREELEAFRKGIQESELGGFVRNEETHWGDAKNEFRGFEIVR